MPTENRKKETKRGGEGRTRNAQQMACGIDPLPEQKKCPKLACPREGFPSVKGGRERERGERKRRRMGGETRVAQTLE